MTESSTDADTAVVFLSHTLDGDVPDHYETLRREARPRDDVFFAYDATDASDDDVRRVREVAGDGLVTFEAPDVLDVDYPNPWENPERRTLVPGNLDLLYLHLARANPGYDRYWFVEFDVVYTGPWAEVFDAPASDADVIGTTLRGYDVDPDWPWWPSFGPPADFARDEWVGGFFPILALSTDALARLDEGLRNGWSGHAEVTIPSIAKYHGLTLEDLGGDGAYVPAGNENRFYTNSPEHSNLWPGTFVYRPVKLAPGDESHTLWHPVKHERDTLRYYGRLVKQWLEVNLFG